MLLGSLLDECTFLIVNAKYLWCSWKAITRRAVAFHWSTRLPWPERLRTWILYFFFFLLYLLWDFTDHHFINCLCLSAKSLEVLAAVDENDFVDFKFNILDFDDCIWKMSGHTELEKHWICLIIYASLNHLFKKCILLLDLACFDLNLIT